MAGTYSIGSVLLQVVPVFRGVQEDAKRHGEALGKSAADGYKESFREGSKDALNDTGKSSAPAARKGGEDSGRAAAQGFNGAFQAAVRGGAQRAMKALGNDIDKGVARYTKALEKLADVKIEADFNGAKAISDLRKFEMEMTKRSNNRTLTYEARLNAAVAGKEAAKARQAIEKEFVKPVEVEVEIAGAFEDKFRARLAALRKSIPTIKIEADSSDVERTLAAISAEIDALSDGKLGIDFDDDGAVERMALLEAQLNDLAEKDVNVSARVNIKAALASVEAFRKDVEKEEPIEIPVRAGFGGAFEAELQSRTKAALAALPEAEIKVDEGEIDQKLADIRARLEALSTYRIDIDGDASEVMRETEEIRAALESLNASEIRPDVDVNVAAAFSSMEAFRKAVARPVDIPVKADPGQFKRSVTEAIDGANRAIGTIKIGADTDPAYRELRAIQTRAEELKANIEAGVTGGAAAAAELKVLEKLARDLDRKGVDIEVRTNAAAAAAQLKLAGNAAKRTGVDSALGANSFRAFNGVLLAALSLGPALIPVLASIGGAIVALGSQATVAALGVGVLALAFSGIGKAVSELNDKSPERNIATATRGIEAAERSLARAREQAARSAEDAGRRVQDAKEAERDAVRGVGKAQDAAARGAKEAARRVVDANERIADSEKDAARAVADAADARDRAARQVEAAARTQRDAERSLAKVQQDALKAQLALTKAKEDASAKQQDLAFQIRRGAIEERQGVIDLFEATVAYNNAKADGGATNLDKENASIGLESARLALEQTRVENARLAAEKAKADAQGVDGSDEVVAAQERVTESVEAQEKARESLADADRGVEEAAQGVVDARVDGEESVLAAQDAVQDAREDAADALAAQRQQELDGAASVVEAQRGVADAQRGVSDSLREQARAAADSQQAVTDAQRGLTEAQENMATVIEQNLEDFNKLGPAGQRFALFIAGLKDELYTLRETAQAGLLPGVETALNTLISTYFPQLNAFVGVIGTTLGNIAVQAANALAGPEWREFFSTFGRVAPGLLEDIASIIGNVATGLAQLFVAFAPYTEEFSEAFVSLTASFADFAAGLTDNPEFQNFMTYLQEAGPQVFDLLISLGDAILNVAVAMAPYAELLVNALIGVLNFIAGLDPDTLETFLVMAIGLGIALQGIFAILSTTAVISGFVSALTGVVSIFSVIAGAAVFGVIVLIGAALVALWLRSETFRDVVTGAFNAIKDAAAALWELMQPGIERVKESFREFGETLSPIITDIQERFKAFQDGFAEFYPKIKPFLDVLKEYIGNVFTNIGTAIGGVVGIIGGAISLIYNVIVGVADIIAGIFTLDGSKIGDGFKSIFIGIFDFLVGIGQAVIDVIAGIVNTIIDFFAHLYDVLVGHSIVPDLVYAIIDWFTNLYNDGVKWIKDLVNGIIDFFVQLAKDVIASVTEFVTAVVKSYKDMWETYIQPIFTALGKGWDDLVASLQKAYDTYLAPMIAALIYIFNNPTDSLKAVFDSVVDGISSKWDKVMQGLKTVYETYVEPMIAALVKVLNDPTTGLGKVFATVVDGIGTVWDGLKKIFAEPIKFVINTVINEGLIDTYESLRTTLHGPDSLKIEHLKVPDSLNFASGGPIPGRFMGPRADNVLIRANPREFMQPVAAVEHYGTDFMEAIRTRRFPKIPGFASGGLVGFGKRLQELGFRVSEHPAFGGVNPVHTSGSKHYSGQAIDVNYGAGGSPANEKPAINGILGLAKEYGLRTIWQSPNHYDHAHFDTGAGRDIMGAITGGISAAFDAISNPLQSITDAIIAVSSGLGESLVGKIAMSAVSRVTDMAGTALGGIMTSAGDWVQDKATGAIDGIKNFFTGSSSVQDTVRNVAKGYGWDSGTAWNDLGWLINKESSWNPTAQNPTSSAYGLFQFLKGTWGTVGASKTSDPNAQAVAGLKYIDQRYGSPSAARSFHQRNNWYADGGLVGKNGEVVPTGLYDKGGVIPQGLSQVVNLTGGNEQAAVFTTDQWDKIETGTGGDKYEINVPMMPTNSTPSAVAQEVLFAARQIGRGGVYANRRAG